MQLSNLFSINLHWLLIGEGEMHSDAPERKDFVYVPRYDVQASAGYGTLIESEQIVDHLAFKRDWLESDLSVDVGESGFNYRRWRQYGADFVSWRFNFTPI